LFRRPGLDECTLALSEKEGLAAGNVCLGRKLPGGSRRNRSPGRVGPRRGFFSSGILNMGSEPSHFLYSFLGRFSAR
jgi:hypothetical protein